MTKQGKENFREELVDLIKRYSLSYMEASTETDLVDSLVDSLEAFENETDNEKQESLDSIYRESERSINYGKY